MSPQGLFTLDLNSCTGCSACAIACKTENAVGEGLSWRNVQTFNETRMPSLSVFHYSFACHHCEEPACLRGCPANAYTKDGSTGAVLLNSERCVGCGYCVWVCPWEAPQMNTSTGVMEKCTFCHHRLQEELEPACVVSCPVDALGYEPAGRALPVDSPGFVDAGLRPSIQIDPKRNLSPKTSIPESLAPTVVPAPVEREAARLRSEWPLLVFTFLMSVLVGWFAAGAAGGPAPHALVFLLLAGLALASSTLHLGKPLRAWRAISNWRHSWLSREILLVSAFLALAAVHLLVTTHLAWAGWLTTAVGFAALFAVDKVYDIPLQLAPAIPHSAMTVLTGAYVMGLLAGEPVLVTGSACVKLVLFLMSPTRPFARDRRAALWRVAMGLVLPSVSVWVDASLWMSLLGALSGEFLDRARFYDELEFASTRRQIAQDMQRLAA